MKKITDETRIRVVCEHIQDGRTLKSLAAEYGVSLATVSNWVRVYREKCLKNDEQKSKLDHMPIVSLLNYYR